MIKLKSSESEQQLERDDDAALELARRYCGGVSNSNKLSSIHGTDAEMNPKR